MRASWSDIQRLRTAVGRAPTGFDDLLRAWPIPGVDRTIVDLHEAAPRCYHDIRHIRENWRIVLEEGRFEAFADHQIDLFAANAFHDAVYEPGSRTNEIRSAEMFSSLHPDEGEGSLWSRTVHDVITATHDHLSPANASLPDWGRFFLDVDLFHLASDPETYAESGRRLCTEFSSVFDREAIMAGRLGWLEGMLSSPRIYWIMTEREEQARRNLEADRADILLRGLDAVDGVDDQSIPKSF